MARVKAGERWTPSGNYFSAEVPWHKTHACKGGLWVALGGDLTEREWRDILTQAGPRQPVETCIRRLAEAGLIK